MSYSKVPYSNVVNLDAWFPIPTCYEEPESYSSVASLDCSSRKMFAGTWLSEAASALEGCSREVLQNDG